MENKKKNEFIAVIADTMSALFAQMCGTDAAQQSKQGAALLDNLATEEQPPAPPVSDEVELLTIKECCEAVKGLNEYTGANRMFAMFAQSGAGRAAYKGKQKAALYGATLFRL